MFAPPPLQARAPAKINLSLHILGRRADGYHELESVVAFTGTGDLLTLHPGEATTLTVDGPTAALAGADGDNLVLRAARALAERVPGLHGGAFALTKRLPVAAGIGGGSSDAAAALRLLARLNGLTPDDPRLQAAAAATGADVPVCLDPRARMMRGIGERLSAALGLPPLATVLVNPGVAVETRQVFGRLGLPVGERRAGVAGQETADARAGSGLIGHLRGLRNDMQAAAVAIAPVIGECLDALSAWPGCRIARMSGSGATCFALFDDCRSAALAARGLRHDHPTWWVRSTILR